MDRTILHVDMDAFYAAVEVRDNPELAGKPLIIGALPHERGVVSTCSYEARKFGVHSAMSIKTAYQLCPKGIYMHPNGAKYKEASDRIHQIWGDYTDLVEYVSLDEGYLDVTGSAHIFGGAREIGQSIKARTRKEVGLTCSVGIGYSMTTAKFASEEKKPDGFFEVLDAATWRRLINDRSVRVLYSVGVKTAEKLETAGIRKVCDVFCHEQKIVRMLGKHGQQIVELAQGIDNRKITPYYEGEAKSIGRENTFQQDTSDRQYLKDVLLLLARELSLKIRFEGLYCRTVTLKVTFGNMKSITRAKSGEATQQAQEIYRMAAELLDTVEKAPIRLVGISLSNLSRNRQHQMSLMDIGGGDTQARKEELDEKLLQLQRKFGVDIIKTGNELRAEKRLKEDENT